MQLTRLGHACVKLEVDGGPTVVIDPGMFSPADAYTGAQAVLITHEHGDHLQADALLAALEADPALRVWTNTAVTALLDAPAGRVHVVGEGDAFDVQGLEVTVHGEWHALIHPDIPRVGNIGFAVGGTFFHPGDSFTLPPGPVETLMLPLHGPWSKAAEVLDYVRAVAPERAIPMHDVMLSDVGRGLMGTLMSNNGAPYHGLESGVALTVG